MDKITLEVGHNVTWQAQGFGYVTHCFQYGNGLGFNSQTYQTKNVLTTEKNTNRKGARVKFSDIEPLACNVIEECNRRYIFVQLLM